MLRSYPKAKLDAFFPKIGELLKMGDFILNARRTGVEVNVFLPFSLIIFDMTDAHKRGIQENPWVLKDFLQEGVRIYWDPNWNTIRSVVLVIDDKSVVQLEGSDNYTLQESRLKFSHANSFNILKGEIQVVQKFHREPPDFDLVLRVDDYPIFLSSDRLARTYNVGDEVEVAYLVNVSGFGTRAPFAPAEIFYEGLGIRLLKKANVMTSHEPMDLHIMVESLMRDFLPRNSDIITEKRMRKWAHNTRMAIREILNSEKLILDAGDDSFIYRTVESVAQRMRERLEHSYLSKGLIGQLSLRFLRYKTKLRDRLLGVP